MQNNDNEEIGKLAFSIVEVKTDGKMSLMSLYDDLPHFEYDLIMENLKSENTKLKTYIQELKQHITKLENENSHSKTLNAVIQNNITALYKTAYDEIQRKDNMIKELRLNEFYRASKQVSKKFSNNDNKKKKIPTLDLGLKVHQKQIKDINNSKKLKKSNENNDGFNKDLTINIQPDKNMPKTIYSKRLYHKFVKENKSMEIKNKIPEEKNEMIITNKQNPTIELGLKVHQKQIKDINNSKKLKKSNENNDGFNKDLTINIQPDKNIPKTIYSKRMCHKFVKENKSMEIKNKIPEEKNEMIITNKQNLTIELGLKVHQKQIEDINNPDKLKNLNVNNDDLIINKKSDKNIPKTVYYKTSCQKFPKKSETIKFHNKKAEEKNEIITNKQNTTVELGLKLHQKQMKHINSSDKSENKKKNNDSLTINKQSDENIPKKVCYKRKCQNVPKENETIKFKNKKIEEIVEIITDNMTDNKNKEFTNDKDKSINLLSDISGETCLVIKPNFVVEHGTIFGRSKERKVTMHSTLDDHKQTTRKGRRVQLTTTKNNYSQPLLSFNGAKETKIDLSKKSLHIEKVIESSSLFYIPQVKKRRVMNFSDCDS